MKCRSSDAGSRKAGTGGFILIAVLWVAMLLSVFALNYATTSRLGAERAMTGERLVGERHVLRSALARAEHELRKYLANEDMLEEFAESAKEEEKPEALKRLFYPRYEPYTLDIDGVQAEVRVVSESGKWNVNIISPTVLENILVACGVEYGAATTGLVNSILDWIDEDDLRRMDGAESPYYLALEHPYPAKNNLLESIEELLLIRGVAPDLFHGTEERPGLIDFLTVSGQAERLDINSASVRSLAIVPGIRKETIEGVLARQAQGRIKAMSDLAPDVNERDYDLLTQYFDVMPVSAVTLKARIVDPSTGRAGRVMSVALDL